MMTLFIEMTHIYNQLRIQNLSLRPKVEFDDIFELVGCKMF